jgi:DNA repair protein RadC
LNSQNEIVEFKDIAQGTVDSSYIYPREVIEGAIKCNAVSLVIVHNHPSGNPDPSESDKELTRDLVYAGSVMKISILDHIIIGDNRYFSFAAAGMIEKSADEIFKLKSK